MDIVSESCGGNSAIVLGFSIGHMLRWLYGALRAEIALSIFNFRWSFSSPSACKRKLTGVSLAEFGSYRKDFKSYGRFSRLWNLTVRGIKEKSYLPIML